MTDQVAPMDCHVHVFLPEKYSYAVQRTYTPGSAKTAELEAHLGHIGATSVVVVQPSTYGTDNRATLDAVRELGAARARGIAVVESEATSGEELSALWRQGVRGIRANLKTAGIHSPLAAEERLRLFDDRLKGTDHMLQVFLPISAVISLRHVFKSLGRPVILDHFGGLKTAAPTVDDDVAGLLDVLELPNVVLKASGACRVTDYAPNSSSLDSIAPLLLDAAKGRTLWGSDWPHTGKSSDRAHRPLTEIEPFMDIDDRASLKDLLRWSGTPERYREIVQDTPNALFGF